MTGQAVETVSPERWVRHMGGQVVTATDDRTWGPLTVGRYRFPRQPHSFTAPPLDRHYLSMTFEGETVVERSLGGGHDAAYFRPGQCLIMTAGQSNTWRWEHPLQEVHFYLCPDFLRSMAQAQERDEARLLDRFAFDDPTLRHLAAAILAQVESRADDPLWIDTACQLFGAHLLGQHCEKTRPAAATGGLSASGLRRVKDLVETRLGETVTLEAMSREAGVSRFHFARMFKASTGATPYRWVQERRVERAKALMLKGRHTLADIALGCGFASQSHFGRVFRQVTGDTPAGWKRARS